MPYRPSKPRQDPEGLDKTAKIKLAGAIAALVIAGTILLFYFMGWSLFGSSVPKEQPLTPQQVEEVQKQKQEIRRKAEEPATPGGKKPVIVGS